MVPSLHHICIGLGWARQKWAELALPIFAHDPNRLDPCEQAYPFPSYTTILSKKKKIIIRKLWKQSLIIKLLGRSIGHKTLLSKLGIMWRPKANFDLVSMDNGFFLVKLVSIDDYEFAKYGGPWLIFKHYITVRPWVPKFDTSQDTLKHLLVWVQIPCLPIVYYDHAFLMTVGGKLANP